MQVDGARLFDIDASNQLLLIARSLSGVGVSNVLTKVMFFGFDKFCLL